MSFGDFGGVDREVGEAWVQPPATVTVLSAEVTVVQTLAPQPGAPVIRRPKRSVPPEPLRGEQRRLGAGLVEVPVVAGQDPAEAVLTDPVVPESRRSCRNCHALLGRGGDGQPGLTEGFCPSCGIPFSFTPALSRGDVVADRYEVVGVLAYGGVSWIYLTQDLHAGYRWVVLKRLIDVHDPHAVAAATTEARVLTEIRHPNIVRIYDLVPDTDPNIASSAGYLAMEYLSGVTLRQLLDRARARDGAPLPVSQVLAYGLEILSALGYLHRHGLLYGDVKPDNVIQSGEGLKLIDFGAVRSMDDRISPVWYTPAFAAPEVHEQGPSVASDLYSVGRTLAWLNRDVNFESYQRFLDRAMDDDPNRRFGSAEEMAEQLTGVLREVVALETGIPRPGPSARFEPLTGMFGTVVAHHGRCTVLAPAPAEIVTALPSPRPDVGTPDDWHAVWQRGLEALAEGQPATAEWAFREVMAALPGELAPKLALAAATELSGNNADAARYYELVWATDRDCRSAAFGLARIRQARADQDGADAVLRSIPGFEPPVAEAPGRPRPSRRPSWHAFATGLANSLIPVPELRPRARRSTRYHHVEARLYDAYARLGPPVPAGKERDR